MPMDFAFDPVTRDLIDDGAGSFELTETASSTLMHQVLCHYGECWHDENLGSLFHDLSAFQAKPELLAKSEAERCFGVLVDRGVITNLETSVSAFVRGRINVATRSRDATTGQVIDQVVKAGG
jgi:hypothetical protein